MQHVETAAFVASRPATLKESLLAIGIVPLSDKEVSDHKEAFENTIRRRTLLSFLPFIGRHVKQRGALPPGSYWSCWTTERSYLERQLASGVIPKQEIVRPLLDKVTSSLPGVFFATERLQLDPIIYATNGKDKEPLVIYFEKADNLVAIAKMRPE